MQINETGIAIDRLNDIRDRLTANFKSIYGPDIVVTPNSPDGQMIGVFSQSLADINELLAFVFQMLDPYQATGAWLEQRTLYAGILRRGAEYSYINNVVITGKPYYSVPKNTVLIDKNRVRWVVIDSALLDSNGSARIKLRSESLGSFELLVNEKLQPEIVMAGVIKIETIERSTPGKTEESDVQLLKRFMQSHSINNNDDRQGIQAALLNIPDVKKALVLENYENKPDEEKGLPPHSLNAIVLDGAEDDIARVLLQKKEGGAAFFGSEEHTIEFRKMNRKVRFDRAKKIPVTVFLEFERLTPSTDLEQEAIKKTLKARDFELHENVYAQKLVCGINTDSNFNLVDIRVNGSSKVDIGWREFAKIENVEVNIV